MTRLTLRYGEDPTTGLPRLEDPSGRLGPADLDALGQEIGRHYERLIGGPDGQLFALNGSGPPHPPRHYRVTVRDRSRRTPTLVLEAVEVVETDGGQGTPEAPPAEAASPAPPGRWQVEFLAEVAELAASARGDGGTRSPLDFVLGDLRALLRKDPRKLTLLLLAGYLHVGNALCLQHDGSGDDRYVQAARTLARVAGEVLPQGVLGPLLSPPGEVAGESAAPPPPEEETSWLRQFFSFC